MRAEIAESTLGRAFFWNVGAPVGLNGANKFDDVLFVQWCFYKMGGWERINPELRAVCRAAHVDGECSGREGDKLIAAIKALQQSEYVIHGAPVDGRISPATKDAQYKHRGTQQVYIIFWLNHVLRALHPEQYPRIDLMPQFVWRIKEQALAPFLA